jgi:hypothetical protein
MISGTEQCTRSTAAIAVPILTTPWAVVSLEPGIRYPWTQTQADGTDGI